MNITSLLNAAARGDDVEIGSALEDTAIDAVDDQGRHALYLAAREGHAQGG